MKSIKNQFNKSEKIHEQDLITPEKAPVIELNLEHASFADQAKIFDVAEDLFKSKTGKRLLENAHKSGYSFYFENMNDFASVSHARKRITISSNATKKQLVSTLAHELRHVEQQKNNVNPDVFKNNMITNIKTCFANEADATLYGAVVAWELKQKGDNTAWEGMKEKTPKVAQIIEQNTSINESLSNETKTKVFKSWFDRDTNILGYSRNWAAFYAKVIGHKKVLEVPKDPKEFSSKEISQSICTNDDNSNYFVDNRDFIGHPPKGMMEEKVKQLFVIAGEKLKIVAGVNDNSAKRMLSKKQVEELKQITKTMVLKTR